MYPLGGRPFAGTEEVAASGGKPNTHLALFSRDRSPCPGAGWARHPWQAGANRACPGSGHSDVLLALVGGWSSRPWGSAENVLGGAGVFACVWVAHFYHP